MKSPTCRDLPQLSIVCHMRRALPFVILLSACADIPALDGTVTEAARNAPYPRLAPLQDQPLPMTQTADHMDDRLAALQRRAIALRARDPGALQ
ncbi:hypothetical protein [Yoonia vestfoldensis]|jgi:hypothetical protein|uniref:Lipoprotein n=1 Tax=Yoonia vestfoldensis TaxID=245188 RepID=A0A1Y0ECQ1_9RHOB|nr:hypothetical protein [Yoonia vestfoldensis]ARU01396.1 hypothetical protein LOKVESSMR4R_02087 [Yoonia vestfoldensis]